MPVEIRELVIRAVVAQDAEDEEDQAQTKPSLDQYALIQECVRQVLNILKKKEER